MMRMKFRLFGAHAGSTIILSGVYFENGQATVDDSPENLGHLERVLRFYRAYSEGSANYDTAVVEEEANGDRSKADETAGGGDSERLLSQHDPSSSGPPDETPTPGENNAPTGSGDERTGSDGGGHEDSGLAKQPSDGNHGIGEPDKVDGDEQDAEPDQEATVDPNARVADWKLVQIVEALDPDVDEHWTKGGLPFIAAVEEAYGSGDVTRALVEQAKPGWTRELAADEKAAYRSNDIEF